MDITKNHRQWSAASPQETKIYRPEKLISIWCCFTERILILTPESYYDNNGIRDTGEFRSSYGKCE